MSAAPLLIALILGGANPREPVVALEPMLEAGWRKLHDLDYDGANRLFREAQLANPEDPRGYLYAGVGVWMRELERRQDLDVSRYVDARHFAKEDERPVDPDALARFTGLLAKARELSDQRLQANPDDVDAHFYLGTAHSAEAGFLATVRHDANAALTVAKLAVEEQRKVIAIDPLYHDAYLTLGLYEYTTGSLPAYVKWVAYLAGYRGDREAGIRMLESAAKQAQTLARDAQLMLTVIYVREGRLDEALELLHGLLDEAPNNHVLRFNIGYCLFQSGRFFEAADSYDEAIRMARPGAIFRRADVQLNEAHALLHAGVSDRPFKLAREVLSDVGLPHEVHTRAHLIAGQAHDLRGERAEAVKQYLLVTRANDDERARVAAMRYLQSPFAPPGVRPDPPPTPTPAGVE